MPIMPPRLPRVILISLLLALLVSPLHAHAQSASAQKKQECVSQIKERTAALVADDWQQLERLAKRYLQTCKDVHDSETLATAHMDLAFAYLHLGNPTAALSATEDCIVLYYASPGCHVRKAIALLKLGRLPDARSAFDIAEKLVGHLITTAQRDLQSPADPSEHELNASKLRFLRALESQIDALRPQLNPQ